MQAALEPYGLDLGHAENGKVAVAKAMSSRWDLIFLDVVMPVMDGIAALHEIRARGNNTQVVLATSVSTAATVGAAVKLGGVTYLRKPFTPEGIRLVAEKLLHLDRSVLASPPRVLVQHIDPNVPRELAKILPPHVVIDATTTLGASIELAEAHGHGLAIFETAKLADEGIAIANVLREALPNAGIFALDPSGTREPWRPNGPLDGVLPRALDASLGRGFLYANFLRPLVFVEHGVARSAGFQGVPTSLPAYLMSLERAFNQRIARLDLSQELKIDLSDVDAEPALVVDLVTRMDSVLRTAGAAPAFRVGAHLVGAPALAHILFA